MKRRLFFALSLLLALAWFTNEQSYAQFADRAIITGVVTDSSGAAIPMPGSQLPTSRPELRPIVGTNSAGNYSTPPLILGTYRVDIEKQGFKVFSRTGNLAHRRVKLCASTPSSMLAQRPKLSR